LMISLILTEKICKKIFSTSFNQKGEKSNG